MFSQPERVSEIVSSCEFTCFSGDKLGCGGFWTEAPWNSVFLLSRQTTRASYINTTQEKFNNIDQDGQSLIKNQKKIKICYQWYANHAVLMHNVFGPFSFRRTADVEDERPLCSDHLRAWLHVTFFPCGFPVSHFGCSSVLRTVGVLLTTSAEEEPFGVRFHYRLICGENQKFTRKETFPQTMDNKISLSNRQQAPQIVYIKIYLCEILTNERANFVAVLPVLPRGANQCQEERLKVWLFQLYQSSKPLKPHTYFPLLTLMH